MAEKIGFRSFLAGIALIFPAFSFGEEPLRVVALSPALAQMCYEILPPQKRHWVVGVSEHTPLPEGANPQRVAAAKFTDHERILALQPTHVFFERGAGTAARTHSKRSGQWLRVEFNSLMDVATQYRRLGNLLGYASVGERLARQFESGLLELKGAWARTGGAKKRVFFQLDENPIVAVGGGKDFLPELIQWLGVDNIFSSLAQSYPRVSKESVIAAAPDLIVVIGLKDERERFVEIAGRWKGRSARVVDGDLLTLPGLSVIAGAKQLLRVLSDSDSHR